jgi:hypothetical protein
MKKLLIILIFAFIGTLNVQSQTTQTDEFTNDVLSGLAKYRVKFKKGDNDSLTFALLPTLFLNPDTKYEFEKINPRIGDEVYVNIIHNDIEDEQITFKEWINTRVHVLDTAQWSIKHRTIVRVYKNEDGTERKVIDKVIRLKNTVTCETLTILFVYDATSSDGTCTNLYSVDVQK